MKAKIFALVAAFFMLMGGSAWAQSDVKGDVNKDGVVNEQDIAAILAIMAKNNGVVEKTKYFMSSTGELYCHRLPMPAEEAVGKCWIH